MNPLCTSQVSPLTDKDMAFIESLAEEENVMEIFDFMEDRKIPSENLNTSAELLERCWLEYWRLKRESPKVTVSCYLYFNYKSYLGFRAKSLS